MVLLSPLALEHNLLTSMEIDVPTTEPVVLESGVENTLIPSEEGDFLITITSDRGVPVVKLTEDEKTLAEGSSLVNREFKAHLFPLINPKFFTSVLMLKIVFKVY